MALFQNAVLNKYLAGVDEKKIEEAWEKFTDHFHNADVQENIRNSKEEAYQEGFLEDLFVKVLGYTKNPAPEYNLVVEQKNLTDSKKADGALLDDEKVRGVIELKGTETTDLGKVETQAFGYKNKQPDAVYVIISNFEKLRFYIDNAVDFIEFNLFQLTKEEFKVLWLCLGYPNFEKGLPKKIKDASLTEEENVTKELYNDYSDFKHAVFESMKEHNPEYDKLLLFKKTQKLLDRFLFIFFAEDRLLLPPNSIREIVNQWMDLRDKYDEYVPLYDRFKKYFGYMNEGHKGNNHEIFAYNGGLFAEDEILQDLKIDDDILYKYTQELSKYDFESEVDVNILGHIFEHSLNEIEEINAELKGEKVDSSKTRRKKDGVFYTPKYITKYIVEHTVGKLCEEKKAELDIVDERFTEAGRRSKKGVADLKNYREWLLDITICDPACGSGAFLNQALEFLIAEHKYLDELQAKYHGEALVLSDIEDQILENNLYGVDINEESVEIAKLSLWLRTAQKGRKLTSLNNHIKCGNSLIDDPEVAGDKAFKWEEEFPSVFKQKEKQAIHVTWVTHNARTSRRMKDYKVKKGKPFWLNEELEVFITKEIATIVEEDELNVLAYNICEDHVHILLVCEPDELPNIVRKLKGRSSQKLKEYLEVPKEEEFHLWAQKFNRKPVEDENGLSNVQEYIKHNREKHDLPSNKGLQETMGKGLQPLGNARQERGEFGYFGMCCSREYAFRPEYTGGFDVVIGNPPYVQSHSLDQETKDFIYDTFETAEYQINTYGIFTEKALELIKDERFYGIIIPNFWLSTKYDSKLRKLVFQTNNTQEIINLFEVFEDATVDTCILIGKRIDNEVFPKKTKVKSVNPSLKTIQDRLLSISSDEWHFDDEQSFHKQDEDIQIRFHPILKLNGATTLQDHFEFYQGMKPYEKGKGTPEQTREMMNKRIYHSDSKTDDSYLPLLKSRNVYRFMLKGTSGFIKYGDNLAASRSKELFVGKRILLNRILSRENIDGIFLDNEMINNTDIINLLPVDEKVKLKAFLPLIVSKLCASFFKLENINLSRKSYPKINVNTLERFPVPKLSEEESEKLISYTDTMQKLHRELYELRVQFLNLLLSKYPMEKPTGKLQSWHELTGDQFLTELNKSLNKENRRRRKADEIELEKPKLKQEQEWLEYFKEQKAEAEELKSQIDQTDKEIDAMVYGLYGLSEEEIAVVEGREG